MISDAAPPEHARAALWPRPAMGYAGALAVALGAPALVTLLAFTSVRTVVPGLLYVVAIILATAAGGRVAGLVAVAASAYPFFHYFAERYDRDQLNYEGATALAVFIVAALFGSEVLGRERAARERAERAVRREPERARHRDAAAERRRRARDRCTRRRRSSTPSSPRACARPRPAAG